MAEAKPRIRAALVEAVGGQGDIVVSKTMRRFPLK
jgi:hypothetical protein